MTTPNSGVVRTGAGEGNTFLGGSIARIGCWLHLGGEKTAEPIWSLGFSLGQVSRGCCSLSQGAQKENGEVWFGHADDSAWGTQVEMSGIHLSMGLLLTRGSWPADIDLAVLDMLGC
jgi:hypothetical protein